MNGFSAAKRQGLMAESRSRVITRAGQSLINGASRYFLGTVALGSGAALLTYILVRTSLLGGLAFAVLVQSGSSLVVWSRSSPDQRERLSRIARVGLVAGILATAMYDLTKFALSHLESSVYNPLEAIRMFGVVLLGRSASSPSIYWAGGIYHGFNGIMFGVAFAFWFGTRGVPAGIAWGFFLESFQLTLFPGWLHIQAYQEFVQISALSHVAYGASLGFTCRQLLGARQSSPVQATGSGKVVL